MKPMILNDSLSLFVIWCCTISIQTATWADVTVKNASQLRQEVKRAEPGDVISLAAGEYGNGITLEKLSGTKAQPIVIAGDPASLPTFTGGNQAFHLVDCNYVTLRNLHVSGCSGNGINADDGGSYETPSRGLVFENITIEKIGPRGNHDGLKLSGLVDFAVRNCKFAGWGGSAIDMVGCQDGVIEGCEFIGIEGFSQDTGVQNKGGTERILIQRNYFENAGQRAVNLGGSTGLQYFRPKLCDYEANEIIVVGNHFVGSMSPIAFVTSTNCEVRKNTIVNPEKWVIRILQEQPTDKFLPCQKGVFEENLIVYDNQVQTFVNVGANTKPESFTFRNNAWFNSQSNRRPTLPVKEEGGIIQVDPQLKHDRTAAPDIGSTDPRLQNVGAHSFVSE
ncbi:right-handed parallel beta-helix repeat-containing protein [Rubinisphaera sp.]|uniref:right-handed parallel beta-helix repeat-containing protein n=1 Tax=Rubinisphaera sp. TaxID=2024857 RepID=UPI0025FF9E84|nr:right-handed parallel beta-helix repeat-containing protein [Rubinisphaera sp.]